MAETRFMRTVEFGGYDRNDVIKRLEFLNTQVFDLKNELRETKLLMEEYKKGTDEEKAHETVLAGEKVKLTSLQVQNETASAKLKAAEEDNKKLSEELEALKAKCADMEKELEDAKSKVNALEAGSEAVALTQVFIEAQKSANALVQKANEEAENKKQQAEDLVKDMIEDANHTAAEIVYEAEKNAAELDAESKNNAEKMKVASNNLKAVMLKDVEALSTHFAELGEMIAELAEKSSERVTESKKLLKITENKLTEGGVPEFRSPELVDPEYPEAPEPRKPSESQKKSNAKLDELAKMAASIAGEGSADDAAETEPAADKKDEPKKGGVDLADLMKQAQALGDQ